MNAAVSVPWTSVAVPHEDIRRHELTMDTYAVDVASVVREDPHTPRVYRDPRAFFEATYLTASLRSLLRDVLHALAGGAGDRVLQLRTPFGGGKSHSLVALYHLASARDQLREFPEIASLPDPGATRIAVLSGTELDPLKGRQIAAGGPVVRTLWGELAWRLGGAELYEHVRMHDEMQIAPGGEILRRVLDGPTTLLLLDEVLIYVERALALPLHDSTVGRQVLVFLQTLTEVVRGLPHAAMVYSLQASAAEAFGDEGILADLDKLVSRVDAKREPVTGDEVLRVVQRRLFENLGDEATRKAVAHAYAELHRRLRESQASGEAERRDAAAEAQQLEERILASYPFHPALIDLMYYRWGSLPSYQRTRGALQFLAQVVHAQWHGPHQRQVQALIGPGDTAIEDEGVRGTLFSQVGERETYSSVLASDLTGSTPRAAEVDARIAAESPTLSPFKVGSRLATAALLYSFGAREGEDRGVAENDLIAACLAPGLDRMVLATALADLRETVLYLHYTGRRYRFETQPNLNKLIADEARKFDSAEVLDRVRKELEARLEAPRGTPVWPPDGQAIPDREPSFTMVYLGLDWAERTPEAIEHGVRELVEKRGSGMREYRNALGFAVPGRQAADKARAAARQLLGVETVLNQRSRFGLRDQEQIEELNERKRNAAADLDGALRRLYEVVYLPVQATPTGGGSASGGSSPIGLDLVDLRADLATSRWVHERIKTALRNHVFDRVTPERLVALTRLGQPATGNAPAGPLVLAADQLASYFFSFLGFPRLRSVDALRAAVAEGIEKGRFGYVAGVAGLDAAGIPSISDGRFVQFGVSVRASELSLESGAFLLAPAIAEQLRAVGVSSAPTPASNGGPATNATSGDMEAGSTYGPSAATAHISDGEGAYGAAAPASSSAASPTTVAPDAKPRRYRLTLSASAAQAFAAFSPLTKLADVAAHMQITIEAVAEQPSGFDQVYIRNAVLEPLEEAGLPVHITAEE